MPDNTVFCLRLFPSSAFLHANPTLSLNLCCCLRLCDSCVPNVSPTAANSLSASGRAAATGNSLKKVLQAAAAAVVGSPVAKPLADLLLSVRRVSSEGGPGQQQQQRRRSSRGGEEAVVLPPVPMHPADKVLSMQVGVLVGVWGKCLGLSLFL
jgi:hypothetical protein